MNTLLKKTSLAILALAGATIVFAEPPKAVAPSKPAPARSVFTLPAGVHEGRDPFFPESTRPYEEVAASKHTMDVTAFVIKGLSIEHGRPMVIINNHTFAVGDEGDVLTTSGRVHLHLVEIRHAAAVIEVNGSRRELSISTK